MNKIASLVLTDQKESFTDKQYLPKTILLSEIIQIKQKETKGNQRMSVAQRLKQVRDQQVKYTGWTEDRLISSPLVSCIFSICLFSNVRSRVLQMALFIIFE